MADVWQVSSFAAVLAVRPDIRCASEIDACQMSAQRGNADIADIINIVRSFGTEAEEGEDENAPGSQSIFCNGAALPLKRI